MSLALVVAIDGIRANMRHFKAVEDTITDAGIGTIYASRRVRVNWETRKPLHSRRVLWILAAQRGGVSPLFPTEAEAMRIYRELKKKVERAIDRAEKSGHSRQRDVQRAVGRYGGGAARRVYRMAYRRLTLGHAGQNTPRRAAAKAGYAKGGTATAAFGIPPPYGIDTGRMVRGLKPRWAMPGGRRRR